MKTLGSITTVRLFTTAPIAMEFSSIEFNKLNILTGVNGVGKSFVMTVVYALGYILNAKIVANKHKMSFDAIGMGQFVIDGCFDASITGTLGINYENSVSVDVAVEDGKVLSVNINGDEDVAEPTTVVYMSSAFRTFGVMCGYLSSRKACGSEDLSVIVQEMIKAYKLYDVSYMERLISLMPLKLNEKSKEVLRNFQMKDEIEEITVDLEKCEFYARLKGGSEHVIHRWYGSGHQALLNMMLGQLL